MCLQRRRLDSIPGPGRSPGEGNWQPTPVFLPKKLHRQRSLVGCRSWVAKSQTQLRSVHYQEGSGRGTTFKGITYPCARSVAQSSPPLCDTLDCSPPGSSVHGFSRQGYWSGLPCPPPEDLPDPRIEPGSPALQADSFFFFSIIYILKHFL